MTPTQRTLAELRRLGYTAWKAERWNSFANKHQDAFGVADILAIREGVCGTLYIQCTSGAHHAERITKIKGTKEGRLLWLTSNVIEVWSWSKKGARGKRKKWELRRERVTW